MKKNTKKSDSIITVLLVLVLVIGLSLLLYPTVSSAWNQYHQTHAIASYAEHVANLDTEEYEQILQEAIAYNQALAQNQEARHLEEDEYTVYEKILLPKSERIMGYIEIPSINVLLPLYHGTADVILQIAVGHLDWTSLPTGGESTHCVVSGHRGLPSARLFTDLDKLVAGDHFMLHVLDETLTYEVDQIRIVEPHEIDELMIQEGKDLCTLLTCTPYGINSHRLLVRGHRVENLAQAQTIRVPADAVIVEKLVVAPFLLIPILFVLFIWLIVSTRKRKRP